MKKQKRRNNIQAQGQSESERTERYKGCKKREMVSLACGMTEIEVITELQYPVL